MTDMLVRLYALPDLDSALAAVAAHGVAIRRAIAPEKPVVLDWVREHFASSVAEVETAFAQVPPTCFVAWSGKRVAGFACHEVTARNFFGPEGVEASMRGKGIGKALLLCALHAQRSAGYAYAIIGGVGPGPAEFYAKCVGATVIEGSTPRIYAAAR
jgi:GNAT superfamily N-acetyltransferase